MKIGKLCEIIGCGKMAVSHSLCDTHRKRKERHGDVNVGRPEDWGRWKNPLNPVWKGFMRYHRKDCLRWHDFLTFASDIGKMPNTSVRFCKKDRQLPYGPDNWFWQQIDDCEANSDKRARRLKSQQEYQKRIKASNPDYFRDSDLRKLYGVTLEWYNKQLSKQNGVCAICGNPETAIIRNKRIQLAVDHCHSTGKVRGLLCRKCNNGIGHFNHDTQLFINAVKYLTD